MAMIQAVRAIPGVSSDFWGNLNVVHTAFEKGSSLSKEFFDNHANDFVYVLQCLFPGASRGCSADGFECRTVGVPRGIAQGLLVRLDNNFETVSLHDRYRGPRDGYSFSLGRLVTLGQTAGAARVLAKSGWDVLV